MAGVDVMFSGTGAARGGRHVHPRHWLIVGGAPRSGTTILGRALDRSGSVALFHEYASHKFFGAIGTLFEEEQRHRGFADFNPDDLMPLSGRDGIAIASDIFKRVTGKRTPIIGTKFPGHQLWPRPAVPPGLTTKELMVVRNPLETVISSIEKSVREEGRAEVRYAADMAQYHWAHAWNYMLLNAGETLLPVIMDRIAQDPAGEAERIAGFLGIEADFDLADMRGASASAQIERRYDSLGLAALHHDLRRSWVPDDWAVRVEEALAGRLLHGVPLHAGEIDFTVAGNSYPYVQHGLHAPEELGTWTEGAGAMIMFRLPDPQPGDYLLTLATGWAPMIAAQTTRIGITVDDVLLTDPMIDLGCRPAQRHSITLPLRNFVPKPAGTCIRFRIDNPRSPMRAGESIDDDRLLGFMLRSLRFERFLGHI